MILSKKSLSNSLTAVVLLLCAVSLLLSGNVPGPMVLRASAMSIGDESPDPGRLKIRAMLGKKSFALGERTPLLLQVTNTGTQVLPVADPRRGGDSLNIWLRMPDGHEENFTTGEALREPGVPEILVDMRIPPGRQQIFEFDLAALTSLRQTGRYTIKLVYVWKTGEQPWRSGEIPFAITARRLKRVRQTADEKEKSMNLIAPQMN